MKFSINRKSFYSSLANVSRAISSLSPINALSGVLINVENDKITLTGSDSNVSIRTTIHSGEDNGLQINEIGNIVLESKYLLEIIKKLDCESVEISVDDNKLGCIKSSNAKFTLLGISSSEYPNIDFSEPEQSFEINGNTLKETIKQTTFACSDKDARPSLTGVYFHINNGILDCCATDSYRLVKKSIQLNNDVQIGVIVPKKSLNELAYILSDKQKVKVHADSKKIQFITDEVLFQSRLIGGIYPDIERIIPARGISTLKADSKNLATVVDRTNFIRTDKVHLVKFDCSSNQTELKTYSAEIGYTNETLQQCNYQGESLSLTLNGTYVLDAIKALGGETTQFEFGGQLKPIKVTNPDDNSIVMVLVPVRDYN